MSFIPNFDTEKAKEFILNYSPPFVKLLYLRDIEGVSINDSEFLELQEKLLAEKILAKLMSKQLDSGAWQLPEKDEVFGPMQRSTVWTLIQLGQLGINGTTIPSIVKAVDYTFEKQFDKKEKIFHNDHPSWGDFMQSHNATILRALIRLGFATRDDVKEASLLHLEKIHGKDGYCKYKKGGNRCAWGLLKNLKFFNEWPENWRNNPLRESITISQDFLLSHNLAEADYPRDSKKKSNHKWFDLSYFKTYYVDIFEAVEALVHSGIKSHPVITDTLKKIGEKCIDQQTWMCELARSWIVKFEKKDTLSPWLSLRGLRIEKFLT